MKKPILRGLLITFILFQFVLSFANDTVYWSVQRNGNVINIRSQQETYQIMLCTPAMIRIRMAGTQGFERNEYWMVQQYDWPEVDYTFAENIDEYRVATNLLQINIQKSPVKISFCDAYGRIISKDSEDDTKPMRYTNNKPSCMKELLPGEHFFGFGERMDFIDQLGKTVVLDVGRGTGSPHEVGAYNILAANYSPVPFFMSTNGYGIFFHNSYQTTWDIGYSSSQQYQFSAGGGEMDYYFIYGPAFLDILQQYTSLTGTSPLLPRFAMGLHVGTYSGGTWGYEDLTSQYYVTELARRFRQLGIPADILHLDSTWRIFGKTNSKGGTSFEWRQPGFPDPKQMFDSLYAMNYKMVGLHIRPRIDNGDTHAYLFKARELGFTYPENGKPGDFLNYFDSASVAWWWDNCLKPLADLGCKFVKTDEGSAFGRKANESDKFGPQGSEVKQLHNIFPIAYARAAYLKFQQYNGIRGLNHTREGYAGIQRYPFIFAGDWPSEWQYFAPVIRGGINISLSGIGAWTHCMGGFEHIADPELYIRWCQFGMFSPIAMLFGMEHPNYKEPWRYGEDALKIFTTYDKLRYRLIPYIYTHYYHMYKTGTPVMQALVLQYPNDPNTYTIDDQYFFGKDLLVCPVTVKGAKTRTLYLPKGDWYDYWTGKKMEGGRYINVLTPLENMPVFARAGAIIPMQPEMNHTGEKPVNPLTLDIYPLSATAFDLYEDDGLTLDYQKGEYALTQIEYRQDKNFAFVDIHSPEGIFQLPDRALVIRLHVDRKPLGTIVDNKKVPESSEAITENAVSSIIPAWNYSQKNNLLYIMCKQKSGKPVSVKIQY
ncbi:MAG TPA: TIM-barrel domain-containing protein [Bacteroidales bacterium]|nr:TIM-barrel domain-containing protein [Bacteroidales bacterium]